MGLLLNSISMPLKTDLRESHSSPRLTNKRYTNRRHLDSNVKALKMEVIMKP